MISQSDSGVLLPQKILEPSRFEWNAQMECSDLVHGLVSGTALPIFRISPRDLEKARLQTSGRNLNHTRTRKILLLLMQSDQSRDNPEYGSRIISRIALYEIPL